MMYLEIQTVDVIALVILPYVLIIHPLQLPQRVQIALLFF